jgi:hypothetical protein
VVGCRLQLVPGSAHRHGDAETTRSWRDPH